MIYSFVKRFIRRDRVSIIIALFVVASASWGFLELADEVSEGESMSFDRETLLALRSGEDANDPIGPVWFEEMARDLTSLGSMAILILLVLIVTVFLILTQKRRDAIILLLASTTGVLVSQSLKGLYSRDRPDLVAHMTEVMTLSFPSGHSMLSATVFLTLGTIVAQAQRGRNVRSFVIFTAVLLTVLVGLTRVYLGVHWPSDVLAGWAAGSAWAMLWWLLATAYKRRLARSVATDSSEDRA